MQIIFTRKHILWLLLLAIGFLLLFFGVNAEIKSASVIPLTELDASHCKEGRYVAGMITSCVKKEVPDLGDGHEEGVSAEHITFRETYEIYTIQTADDFYIRLMVGESNVDLSMQMERLDEEHPVYFEGVLWKSPLTKLEGNTAWYEDIEAFHIDDIEPNLVLKPAAIYEKGRMIYPGISIILLCIFMLFAGDVKLIIFKEPAYFPEKTKKVT